MESGEVRGFVKKEYLQTGRKVKKKVNKTGADRFTLAVARVGSEGKSGTLLYVDFGENGNSGRGDP